MIPYRLVELQLPDALMSKRKVLVVQLDATRGDGKTAQFRLPVPMKDWVEPSKEVLEATLHDLEVNLIETCKRAGCKPVRFTLPPEQLSAEVVKRLTAFLLAAVKPKHGAAVHLGGL